MMRFINNISLSYQNIFTISRQMSSKSSRNKSLGHGKKSLKFGIQNDTISSRELGFKYTKRVTELGNKKKYLDMIHLVFGPAKSRTLTPTQMERIKAVSEPQSTSLKKPFGKFALKAPEVWNAVIQSLASEGLMDEAFAVFSRMKESKVQYTDQTITSLLTACTNFIKNHPDVAQSDKGFAKAMRLYYRLRNSSFTLSTIHMNALLLCCSRAKKWHALFSLYETMDRPESEDRKRLQMSLGDFIKDYRSRPKKKLKIKGGDVLKEGMVLKADDIADNFDFDRPAPHSSEKNMIFADKITYYTLLSACASRGGDAAFKDAQVVWKNLLKDCKKENVEDEDDLFQRLVKKNSAKETKIEFILSEDEFEEWQKVEKSRKMFKYEKPDVSVDTRLVNAMLLACKNAEKRTNVIYSLNICFDYFGTSMNWMDFYEYIKENHKEKYFEKVRAIAQSAGISKHHREHGAPLPTCLPDAKTLAILMNILNKKLHLEPELVCEFYRHSTKLKPKHLRILPDKSVREYYGILADMSKNGVKEAITHKKGDKTPKVENKTNKA